MRFSRVFSCFILMLAAASAAELKIKVVDSQSAAVAGAQVTVSDPAESTPAEVTTTSAEGVAVFHTTSAGPFRVRILAPGFAVQDADIPSLENGITVTLRLAAASETVVVTATRTPVPGAAAGAARCSERGGEEHAALAVRLTREADELARLPADQDAILAGAERAAALVRVLQAAQVLDGEVEAMLRVAARGLRDAVQPGTQSIYRARIDALDARLA